MAEIILPPEENEETPQEPELNIDKPTENSKVITIEFEAKKTNKVSAKDTNQQLYTTDTDAWFEFKETSLEGANGTYSVVFRNRHDGSIFQRTGDVVNGVAYYKIPHQEIRHAGAWRGQIVYTLSNGDTTAREFGYDVKGHILDGKDVREIVVEDFETLMSQLRSMKDNAELELADLVNTAERNELERQQFYESLVEDINDLQENYQELLDTGVLQTSINTKLEALEEEYAPKLTEVAAQLAQTEYEATRKRKLEDLEPEVIAAIEGGEGTSFDLLSIPQDLSVTTKKLDSFLKDELLFKNNLVDSFRTNIEKWEGEGVDLALEGNNLKIEGRIGSDFARAMTSIKLPHSQGDKLFVRIKVKLTNNQDLDTTKTRILIRNGAKGHIHSTHVEKLELNEWKDIYFYTNLNESVDDLRLMVDLYDNVNIDTIGRSLLISYSYVGNATDLFGDDIPTKGEFVNLLGSRESIYNPETIFRKVMELQKNADIFEMNAENVINQSMVQINKSSTGQVNYETLDYYKFPLSKVWGHEYLYSWYKKIKNDEYIKMVWAGDSTTENAFIRDKNFHRNNLAKKIMILGGYDESKIISLNHGHGANHTRNWLDTHLANDMVENPDLYIFGYGLNDGGSNYFPGSTIQERLDGFEQRLRDGLTQIRSSDGYNKKPEEMAIILCMPVTTNNPDRGRIKEDWHNNVRPIIQKAARDFQCAFVDIALHQYDRTYSSEWSSNGDNVHPDEVSTADYMSLFKELLIPYALQK